MRLALMIASYANLTPAQKVEQLKKDLQDPLFMKTALATFGPAKYLLKPEPLLKFLAGPKAAAIKIDRLETITMEWWGWNILAAMACGDITGDAAKAALGQEYVRLSEDDKAVVNMILDKTWRNGVTITTINEAVPNTFRPTKFQLAHKLDDRVEKGKDTWPKIATTKYDGFRAGFCQDTQRALSRPGNEFPITAELKDALIALGRGLQEAYGIDYTPALDGELFAGDWASTASARKVGYDEMIVFSMLPSEVLYGGKAEEFDVWEFFDQVDKLIYELGLMGWLRTPHRRKVANLEQAQAFYKEQLANGDEGAILVEPMMAHEGKRSYNWLKMKPADPIDAKIVGVILGKPRSKNEGKVVSLEFEHNGVVSAAGNMKQSVIDKITALHEEGNLVGLTALVVVHELTPDGAFRHGRVKDIRFDK